MCSTYSARTDIHNAVLYGLDPSIYLNISAIALTRMAIVAAMVRPVCYRRMKQLLLLSNALPPLLPVTRSFLLFKQHQARQARCGLEERNTGLTTSQPRYTIETPSAFT